MSYQETEIKLLVTDLHAMEKRLQENGAQLKKPRVYERNLRFDNQDGTFVKQGLVLRLRQDDRIRLTYKSAGEVVGDNIISRFEAEVEVSDFDTMRVILEHLGYAPAMVYEKYRTTYELNGAEIVLDEMPYGNFVEIEGEADVIRTLIPQLGLEDKPRFSASYARLFDRVRRYLKLNIHDLTFENFQGVDVPIEAFNA